MPYTRKQLARVAQRVAERTKCIDCIFVVDRSSNHRAKSADAIVAENFIKSGGKVTRGKKVLMRNTDVVVAGTTTPQSLNHITIPFTECTVELTVDWKNGKNPGEVVTTLSADLSGATVTLGDSDPAMDRLRAAVHGQSGQSIDAAINQVVDTCRRKAEDVLMEEYKATFLTYRDDDNDDGNPYSTHWAKYKPVVIGAVVKSPLGVGNVTWGTRPALDILRERKTPEQWGDLEAKFKFKGDPSARTLAAIFREEPDVQAEVPSICHAVLEAARANQGSGPPRVGMRCEFLPVAHAELNPIELLWATLRACRRCGTVAVARAKTDAGQIKSLKRLVALMMIYVPPELIRRFYSHVHHIEGLYEDHKTGPAVMHALAASKSGRKSRAATFEWASHWCPPKIHAIANDAIRGGQAAPIRQVVREFAKVQSTSGKAAEDFNSVADAVLGTSGRAADWNGLDCVAWNETQA